MKEYLPCSTPLCASEGLTTCQSRLPSAVRLLAISLPALNGCPDTTAPRSELTSATGILFTWPNGSQNAHRYNAPYTSGSSISTTIASRVIRLRPKRLISEPNASPASIVSPLRSGCGDRVIRGPARRYRADWSPRRRRWTALRVRPVAPPRSCAGRYRGPARDRRPPELDGSIASPA